MRVPVSVTREGWLRDRKGNMGKSGKALTEEREGEKSVQGRRGRKNNAKGV